MRETAKLKVLYIEPMKTPKIVEIDGDLESMQNLVGGYIEEYMPFEDEVAIVCNDEGKINGLEPNRGIFDKEGELQDIICGSFFICYAPVESEKYLSLPDNLRKKYEEMFRHPEIITRTDTGDLKIRRLFLPGRDIDRNER
ncbi:DUF3846 domain-containing protein [Zhenpiania hominis]|uniref:DUF3846 domain-containing protein n=1 Tax=Zhenpiania hominis TaxID=2763644 RepID=A0A923NMA0_9FIRM|nr:DUF3846 domain-containing protein [Zhenpiania hominis]MBC6678653.1 DUF3846 domain-containing protein [Zhenpiania hominis]